MEGLSQVWVLGHGSQQDLGTAPDSRLTSGRRQDGTGLPQALVNSRKYTKRGVACHPAAVINLGRNRDPFCMQSYCFHRTSRSDYQQSCFIFSHYTSFRASLCFPGGSDGKVFVCNTGDPGLIPGLGRSPEEGNVHPLQHSCLENPMDGGA